jgi:Trk K+ transport system NAD-binding subunit
LGTLEALERVRLANEEGNKLAFLSAARVPQRPGERLNTVIVCGLGKVGAEMVRLLAALRPAPELVVICKGDTPARLIDDLTRQGVRIIQGDARDPALLVEAGIERAYAVAAVVSDDLTNLQVALDARKLRPDVHLVLRVFSDVLAERLAALFGINTTYSTSALAAPTLAAAAVLREVDHAFDVGARLFATETLCVSVGDRLAGATVATLRSKHELLVTALRRAGVATLLPRHDTRLAPGDEVVLLADLKALARLRAR